jgi:parallel beta-helix repeat protein
MSGKRISQLPRASRLDSEALLEISQGGQSQSVTAAQVVSGAARYFVGDFGAKGDGITDDQPAITAAIAACFASGGGTVDFGPFTYRLLERIDMLNGVALRGVAGQTKLDFSGKTKFENGWLSGLIRAQGVLGAPVPITHGLRRTTLTPRTVIGPTSHTASISGTTMTLSASATLPIGAVVTGVHVVVDGDGVETKTYVANNTVIVSGSGTSYQVSPSQTVASTTMSVWSVGKRVGTTVTVTVDVRHIFEVGDPIWVTGIDDKDNQDPGQAVFFTMKWGPPYSESARTNPYFVTGVIDDFTFTYGVADEGDAQLTRRAKIFFSSDTVMVADTSGFSVGQNVQIQSDQGRYRVDFDYGDVPFGPLLIGEFGKVSRIVSPTQLRLHADVQDDYPETWVDPVGTTKPANLKLAPVTTVFHNMSVEGFEIIGKGPNLLTSSLGDRGIMAYLCEMPIVRRCTFTHVDYNQILIWSCFGGRVSENMHKWDSTDEAGSLTGMIHVQYGVGFGGCTFGLVITNNHFWGGRHSVVQTFNSEGVGGPYYGVSRHIHVVDNSMQGQWLASIATHQGVEVLTIRGNTINSRLGVDPRFGRDTVVTNNIITAETRGIYVYNVADNIVISNNTIRAGEVPIYIGENLELNDRFGPLKITDNQLVGGQYGIQIQDTTPGLVTQDFDISGNIIRATINEAIIVRIGDTASASDGWYGKINNNIFVDTGREGDRYGMRLTNFKGGQVNGNIFRSTTSLQLNYAVYLEGAGTGDRLQFLDNWIKPGLIEQRTFQATVGYWHLTNMPPVSATDAGTVAVIVGGVASPRFARPMVVIDTEAAAAADDLDTLLAGFIGQTVILRSYNAGRVITVRDGTGNIQTAGGVARVLDNTRDMLTLVWDGTAWVETAFASN